MMPKILVAGVGNIFLGDDAFGPEVARLLLRRHWPDLSELDRAAIEGAAIESHGMNPMRVLAVARAMGAQFRRIMVLGCERSPETIDPDGPGGMGLSEPVRRAMGEAITIVERLVAQAASESARAQMQTTGGSRRWERWLESSAVS
jgi:hydrogenase maturation protease